MDWRRCFADYQAALVSHERAQGHVDQLQARLSASATEDEKAALRNGIAVARLRLNLTSRTLASAADAFARGASVLDAVWSAPDDV